jgi:hypothetical protein
MLQVLRRLYRAPFFSVVVVVCMSLSLAMAYAGARIVGGLLWRSQPGVAYPQQLVRVLFEHRGTPSEGVSMRKTSYAVFRDI